MCCTLFSESGPRSCACAGVERAHHETPARFSLLTSLCSTSDTARLQPFIILALRLPGELPTRCWPSWATPCGLPRRPPPWGAPVPEPRGDILGLRLERQREDCLGSSSFGCPAVGPLGVGAPGHPSGAAARFRDWCMRMWLRTLSGTTTPRSFLWAGELFDGGLRWSGVVYTSLGATRSSVQA
jgi:hypothetical protein